MDKRFLIVGTGSRTGKRYEVGSYKSLAVAESELAHMNRPRRFGRGASIAFHLEDRGAA